MELRHLRYFIAVARELNLSRAAEVLNTSQPSLGQQMRALEDDIGVKLFVREKNKLELTEAGRVLAEQSDALLSQLDASIKLVRSAGRGEVGAIRIGTSPAADAKVLPVLLPRIRLEFSDMEFNLRCMSGRDELIASLVRREIDVAFLRGPLVEEELTSAVILREHFVAVLPGDHGLAKREKVKLQELISLPFMMNPPVSISDEVKSALREAGVTELTRRLEWDTRNVIVDLNLIGSGLGFTLLPDYVRLIAPSSCAVVDLDLAAPLQIDLLVGYRRDNHSPMLNFLLATLRQCFPV
jgi:LysR family hca operon transcriptional activator